MITPDCNPSLGATWVGCHPQQYTPGRAFNMKPQAIGIHVMLGTLVGTDAFFNSSPQQRLDAANAVWEKNGRKGPRPSQSLGAYQSSAAYGIGGATGLKVHQYVKETDTSWHAGVVVGATWQGLKNFPAGRNPNAYSIGIEHEGFANTPWSDALYSTSAALIADICARWSIPCDRDHIFGHYELYSPKKGVCPGLCDLDKLIASAARML